jgi:hypothetical protein
LGLIYGLRLVEGPCVVREYTSAATTTYDAGDVVSVANGSVGIGAHDAIAGVALKDAGGTDTMTPIIQITPDQIWNIGYATTTALDLIGDTYLMDFATGAQYLTATTSTPTCIVVGLDARDGVKLYGRVNVRFLPSTCTFAGGVLA